MRLLTWLLGRNDEASLHHVSRLSLPDRVEFASNAETAVPALNKLAKDSDEEVRAAVALNPSTPRRTLARLAKDREPYVREAVALNHHAPPDVLERLADDIDPDVRLEVARNYRLRTSIDTLSRLTNDPNAEVRALAERSLNIANEVQQECSGEPEEPARTALAKTRVERLVELARHSDPGFRAQAAVHPDTPADQLAELASDTSADVRTAVAKNAGSPRHVLAGLVNDSISSVRIALASNLNTSYKMLSALADDTDVDVRCQVARHPYTSMRILKRLARDSESTVRQFVATNPKLPEPSFRKLLLSMIDPRKRKRVVLSPDLAVWKLELFLTDSNAVVREFAEQRIYEASERIGNDFPNPTAPDASTDELLVCAQFPDAIIQRMVAEHASAPSKALSMLAGAGEAPTRKAVAAHTATPEGILIELLEDEDGEVREEAQKNLRGRRIRNTRPYDSDAEEDRPSLEVERSECAATRPREPAARPSAESRTVEVTLPLPAEDIESGYVLTVLVNEGETIAVDQDIVELELDKATIQVRSSHAGKVTKIHVSAGDTVIVGATLVSLETASAPAATPTTYHSPEKPGSQEGEYIRKPAERPARATQPAGPSDDDRVFNELLTTLKPRGLEIIRELGRGGMGRVVLVRATQSGEEFAVKACELSDARSLQFQFAELQLWRSLPIHPHFVRCLGFIGNEDWRRIRDRFQDLTIEEKINSPEFAKRAAASDFGNLLLIACEYVDGGSLAAWMDGGRLTDIAIKLDIAIQIARGLKALHTLGFVHRDVKPANILMTFDGVARLTDFGLSRSPGRLSSEDFTAGGGTPAYASPEQFRGTPLDHRTDIWSWGVVLFEMLTGHRPAIVGEVAGEGLEEYLRQERAEPIHPEIANLLQRCFRRDLDRRLGNLDEGISTLKRIYKEITGVAFPRAAPPAVPAPVSLEEAGKRSAARIQKEQREKQAKIGMKLLPAFRELEAMTNAEASEERKVKIVAAMVFISEELMSAINTTTYQDNLAREAQKVRWQLGNVREYIGHSHPAFQKVEALADEVASWAEETHRIYEEGMQEADRAMAAIMHQPGDWEEKTARLEEATAFFIQNDSSNGEFPSTQVNQQSNTPDRDADSVRIYVWKNEAGDDVISFQRPRSAISVQVFDVSGPYDLHEAVVANWARVRANLEKDGFTFRLISH